MTITLDGMQTLGLAVVLLLVGGLLNARVALLARYNIPQPITGGLAFAVVSSMLFLSGGVQFSISDALRGPLLLVFFATVGLAADLRRLKQGGPTLALLLAALLPFLLLQNVVGVGLAILLDQHPLVGLIGGTVTLVGGHGTGAAYAAILSDTHNLAGVAGMALAAATCGLILGGIAGGPVAQFLLRNQDRSAAAVPAPPTTSAVPAETEPVEAMNADTVLRGLTLIVTCVVAGRALAELAQGLPIALPDFLWCLFLGVVLRNLLGMGLGWQVPESSIELTGNLALALFLAMTMATLRIWELATLAGPLLLIVLIQLVVAVLYAVLVIYRMMGRGYEAAIMSAGFLGVSVGTTATAIANMQALVDRYGPAPIAFLVIPLAGAFFIDLANALVLAGALALPVFGE